MALPSIANLKMWVGTLFTKDDWDFNFSQLVSWLADGTSDIVVNTIKTTSGIDLDGAQISNVGAATTGSQAINLDQANTLLNRSSNYYPFSVASGKVDSNGNANYLQKDSDTQVTVLAGNVNPDLVCVSSDGTIESVTSNVVLTVPVSDGTYHIIKEKGETITITSGASSKVTIAKVQPISPNVGDYYLDNATVPFKGYKYTSDGWEETPFCWLGEVTVLSGTATVSPFNYNNNRFNVLLIESYVNGADWYRVYSDGWCEQGGIIDNGSAINAYYTKVTFIKEFKDTNYMRMATPQSTAADASTTANTYEPSTTDMGVNVNRTYNSGAVSRYCSWYVAGYLKEGEY